MVDVTTVPRSVEPGSFMGLTRGALRSMRSVLGGGGEYLQDLGNRIGTALSISVEESDPTTSPSTHTYRTRVTKPTRNLKQDFEPRRAADHLYSSETSQKNNDRMISGNIKQQEMARCTQIGRKYMGMTYEEISSSKSISIKEPNSRKLEEIITPDMDSTDSNEQFQANDLITPEHESLDKLNCKIDMPSSKGSISDADYGMSSSLDSMADSCKDWQRPASSTSIQSWASNLSIDSQSEDGAAEFMKMFVTMLFESPTTIKLEQKATFGKMVLAEAGRLWFARVVNARRAYPCVTEESFYSLAQHFAVTLFECYEADDFGPAKSLMNMCFTFYHEVEVPGVEPYREYLYTNLRVQPIWTSMRFWTAAFFEAVQCERSIKPVSPRAKSLDQEIAVAEDKKFQANIVFGQLGTFTCNMHAFGLPRNLCLEFLRKQCIIANLTQDQEKMLRDNIQRMFDETEPWR